MMKMSCRKKVALESRKDAIVIPVFKNIPSLRNITGKKIDDELQSILDSDYFNYDEKEIKSFYIELNKKLKKIYLINAPKEPEDPEIYREMGAKISKILNADKIHTISLIAFEDIYNEKKDFTCTTSFMEGVLFGMYSFDTYKSKKSAKTLNEVEIITNTNRLKTYIDNNLEEWNLIFQYVDMAKDLVNTPSCDLTPEKFVEFAKNNCNEKVKMTVFDSAAMKEKGLNLINAVGQGSANPPFLVKLEYKGKPDKSQNVALVGKGVTFDSGGSSLKPASSMEDMKSDMGGGAAVFSIINLAAACNLPVNINAYIPLVENIIGGNALRPGDIVQSYSGKTVEVLNTDAEGRLILADALFMATESDPEVIIDLATLTGGCVVALGEHCAGLFSNRKFLSKQLSDVASKVGEDVWELPLFEGYESNIKSENADLRNIGKSRYGGTINAALFLKEFVDNYPWVHLDIAGAAFVSAPHPVFGSQATGFGVRLVYHFIKSHYLGE